MGEGNKWTAEDLWLASHDFWHTILAKIHMNSCGTFLLDQNNKVKTGELNNEENGSNIAGGLI